MLDPEMLPSFWSERVSLSMLESSQECKSWSGMAFSWWEKPTKRSKVLLDSRVMKQKCVSDCELPSSIVNVLILYILIIPNVSLIPPNLPSTRLDETKCSVSFSDLNMLAEAEGSDHLDFQEHSKGKLRCPCLIFCLCEELMDCWSGTLTSYFECMQSFMCVPASWRPL